MRPSVISSWYVCCRKSGAARAYFWDIWLWDIRFPLDISFSSCLECFVMFWESWILLLEIFRTFWNIPSHCFLTSLCQKLIQQKILVTWVIILIRVCYPYLFIFYLGDQKLLVLIFSYEPARQRFLWIQSHAFLMIIFKREFWVKTFRTLLWVFKITLRQLVHTLHVLSKDNWTFLIWYLPVLRNTFRLYTLRVLSLFGTWT